MAERPISVTEPFDRTNAIIAGVVGFISFIVYALTVQPTFSFWDCGEFIACSYTLGIPHPPGTPLFILIGRIFSMIPFAEDISHRVNYLSVITSAFTAAFSYLLIVRIVGMLFGERKHEFSNRLIAYIGGIAGGFFVAFGRTNWANSVEAEVYGMALALSVMIVWLALRYYTQRGTAAGNRTLILLFYLAMLGIGVHMTVFLVVPVAALFFILNKEAEPRDYAILSLFVIVELLLIFMFSQIGGMAAPQKEVGFYLVTAILGGGLVLWLYKKINWALLIATISVSTIMISFSLYLETLPFFIALMIILGAISEKRGWKLKWRTGLAVMIIGILGMSCHAYIPIRSAHNPRIDENDPSRNWYTFIKFLDRKQYGQMSMVERMFDRRGKVSNQFGRHAHMGFWSYFEDQYSTTGWGFMPFFLIGLLGLIVAIRKREEVGLPFLTLILVTSVGLILYMNFADGTQYDPRTGDAYLEVRNRDYFFTPAFVFFGVAMGLGISALSWIFRDAISRSRPGMEKVAVYTSAVLILLPGFALGHNWHANDRSENFIPYNYAANLLDTCEENAILFTSGDNDTFPLWCIQEVYDYRKDIRVVNLSLLNTDWYVYQMKHTYNVPISLSDDQILWEPFPGPEGSTLERPKERFRDRPRGRLTYMMALPHEGRIVKVQDMMMDEIVIQNRWKDPIFFSSPPYDESPLGLRDRTTTVGVAYRLDREPPERNIDATEGYKLFHETYRFDGYGDPSVYRDDNATGVYLGYGISAVRLWDEFLRRGQPDSAYAIADLMIEEYPEYWQMYFLRSAEFENNGDTASADSLMMLLHGRLTDFMESNPENNFYRIDLGLTKVEIGSGNDDQAMIDRGIELMWEAFRNNPNSAHLFRKLVTVLSNQRRFSDIQRAATMHAEYKRNLNDPFLQQLMGRSPASPPPSLPGQ